MEICLTVLKGESSTSNDKSFTNSSTFMVVIKFLLMAGNRPELPCDEPLVEMCLPCEVRYPVCFPHGLMCECQSSASLFQAIVWTCSNYWFVEFHQYFYCAVKHSSVQIFYIFIFLCIAKRSILKCFQLDVWRTHTMSSLSLLSFLLLMHSHAQSMSTFLMLCDHFSLLFWSCHVLISLAGLNLLLVSSCIVSELSRKMCDKHKTG